LEVWGTGQAVAGWQGGRVAGRGQMGATRIAASVTLATATFLSGLAAMDCDCDCDCHGHGHGHGNSNCNPTRCVSQSTRGQTGDQGRPDREAMP
jgi:hypothetical protein